MNTRTSHQGTTTVADYLLARLSQAGVISVFGVPGDYNLPVLEAIAARNAAVTLHHNLPGGDFGHFARMAAEVTADQAADPPARAGQPDA